MWLEKGCRLRNLPSVPRNNSHETAVHSRPGSLPGVHTGTPIALNARMRQPHVFALLIGSAALVGLEAAHLARIRAQEQAGYRIETRADRTGSLKDRFNASQLAL